MEDVSLMAKFMTSQDQRLHKAKLHADFRIQRRVPIALNCVSTVCLACIWCCGSTCGQVLGEIHISSEVRICPAKLQTENHTGDENG